MNAPVPVAWWIVTFVVGVLCLGFYVLGGEHTKRDEDWRIRRVVEANRYHNTLIRHLYEACELLMPELEPEPQPAPSRRQRIGRRIGRAWAALQRQQRPTPQAVDEAEEEWSEPESYAEVLQEPEPEAPDFVVNPNPSTAPIVMPEPVGIPTQPDMKAAAQVAPLPSITYEDWKADFDARVERDMAAIRGTE